MSDITRGSLTPEEVAKYEDALTRHYGEPVRPVNRYCRRLLEYATALEQVIEDPQPNRCGPFHTKAEAETVRDALKLLGTWASKSNALSRLMYGDEPLRKEKCPIHKGRWSGCKFFGEIECGCELGACFGSRFHPRRRESFRGGFSYPRRPRRDEVALCSGWATPARDCAVWTARR